MRKPWLDCFNGNQAFRGPIVIKDDQWIIEVMIDIQKYLELNNRKKLSSQFQDLIHQFTVLQSSKRSDSVKETQE